MLIDLLPPIAACFACRNNVVVIGVAVFDDLNVDHLWMIFGKGKDLRRIPIHDIC
jgi:hypothetical protein